MSPSATYTDGLFFTGISMSKKEKGSVAKAAATVLETPTLIKIGRKTFKILPLTLSQIYEIGAVVERIDSLDMQGDVNVIVETLRRYKDFQQMQQLVMIMLFRRHCKRRWWNRYVHRHLTMELYQKVLETGIESFKAAFFLTSITFLKGLRKMTEPTNTPEATARGD